MTVLEYMNGGNLSKVIHQRKIGNYRKLSLANDIASGLAYLHGEFNIVHQDIKPENILVS